LWAFINYDCKKSYNIGPRLGGKKTQGAEDEEAPVKKKRYVLLRTLADGTQLKSVISPDDPILNKEC
jgi:hypothetical protein